MSGLPISAFDPSRYIGTVCQVDPNTVRVNLPYAASSSFGHHAGFSVPAGQVGEFVLIEGEGHAILGRITEVRLPERDRLVVEPTSGEHGDTNPIGLVQLLTAIDLASGESTGGVSSHPRIAQQVFSAHPQIVKHVVEQSRTDDKRVKLASLAHSLSTTVSVDPEAIFGRHCAVLGATGGGKSWTVARLVEEVARLSGKAILFDATGEYEDLRDGVRHVYLGGAPVDDDDSRKFVSYPFWRLADSDIFVLFNPTGASQAPKLREALKSLKLAKLKPALAPDGFIPKVNQLKSPIESALTANASEIDKEGAVYDIQKLARQVQEECVYPAANFNKDHTRWGDPSNELTYCISLVARIEVAVKSSHMDCIFKPGRLPALPDVIREFLDSEDRVLRVSMEHLPFEHHTRELVVNAVGRHLLVEARRGSFRELPTVVFLDEAHQFLNRTFGDDYSRVELDSFGVIAKEGRKYGLTVVLATQRPRDIPEDVLSQMGMFVVHRLINEKDRQVVERACGNMDASAAAFLPALGQGEAILVGVDSPVPLPVQISVPTAKPHSEGPGYGRHWGGAR